MKTWWCAPSTSSADVQAALGKRSHTARGSMRLSITLSVPQIVATGHLIALASGGAGEGVLN